MALKNVIKLSDSFCFVYWILVQYCIYKDLYCTNYLRAEIDVLFVLERSLYLLKVDLV